MDNGREIHSMKISDCYRLPWTELDNPNGWIEPTTLCNIACPGCYRGIDRPEHSPKHLGLAELKSQIDWFKTKRNVHTISIAGGEPLMYPQIIELIEYAVGKNLRTMLYTNGVLLDAEMAEKLAAAGLTQVVVHTDRFQSRPDLKKDESHIKLREKYVEIVRNFPALRLGFIQPISADCNGELFTVMEFLEKNIDVVNLMVFTLYRNICWTESCSKELNTDITVQNLIDNIRKGYEYVPAAYLPATGNSNEFAWLFAQRVGLPGKIFGYFSPSFYAFAHKRYRRKSGRHLFISRINSIQVSSLAQFVLRKSVRKIVFNYLKYRKTNKEIEKNKLFFQTLLIIRGPEKRSGKWDLCNGCPDRMIYNGKLVPSCILEDLRGKDLADYNNL